MNHYPIEDRRTHPRHVHDDRLLIHIVSPSEANTARNYYCTSKDVSKEGLRLELDQQLHVGSIVHLWINAVNRPGTLVLKAEVMWSSPSEDLEHFYAGLALMEEPADQVEAWKAMIEEVFPD